MADEARYISKDWLNPICGCSKNSTHMLLCIFCPCIIHFCIHPASIAITGERSCCNACCIETLFYPICCLCTDSNRRLIIKKYGVEESCLKLGFFKICCCLCSEL